MAGGPSTGINCGGTMAGEELLRVEGLNKTISNTSILSDVDMVVNKGDLKVLIGPSGGGKSTLLQCINLLLFPDSGRIVLDGREVTFRRKREVLAYRQQIGMIFQEFNLFDHLNAQQNVSIALISGS